jgi:hypothetical protein
VPTQTSKAWAVQLQENHYVTIAMSCAIVGLSRCAYYYQPKLLDDSVIMSVLTLGYLKLFCKVGFINMNGNLFNIELGSEGTQLN